MASSDELLDDANAEIPAESQDKTKTEFINRVKKKKSEIKTKFQDARKKLDEKELKILNRVEEIEKEIMDDYEKNAITLKEITQAKGHLLSTFKSNTTNTLLKKNVEIIDKEIEEIKKNSKIDSTIDLVWKMEQLDLYRDNMCEVSIILKNSPHKIPLQTQITVQSDSQTPFIFPRQIPNQSQQLPPFQPQMIQSNQTHCQQNFGKYGFVKENPSENQQTINEPKSLEEDDENFAFSELLSYIDNMREERKVTLAKADPKKFAEWVKKASSLPMKEKYTKIPIHSIINRNLSSGRDLGTIKAGFCGLFKFTFCIIMDNEIPEITQLKVDQGPFERYVSRNISFTNEVMQKLGYQQDSNSPMLLRLTKLDSKHDINLLIMCCELLIAIQELTDFNPSIHGNPNEYFASQSEANPEPNPKRFSGKRIDPGTPQVQPRQLPPQQAQNIQLNQAYYQRILGPSLFGFMKDNPFENQPIEEPNSSEDDKNDPFTEFQTIPADLIRTGEPNNYLSQLPPPHAQPQQLPQAQSRPLRTLSQPQAQHIAKRDLLPRDNHSSKSRSILPLDEDVFEKYLRTYRNSKNVVLKPNLFDDIPDALKMDARKCIDLPLDKKCTVVNLYAIISNNLNQGKDLNQVRQGLTNLSKVAFCVYLDPTFESIRGFNVDTGFYKTYIADLISDVHEIVTALGYVNRQKYLELNARPENNARLERIGCELFIFLEDMNDIGSITSQPREILHYFAKLANESKIQPIQHQRPNLQATKQSSLEKSTYGFVKENPFENQPMDEPKSKLEEDEDNFAFSELLSYIDSLKEEKFKVSLATADPEKFAELAKKATSLPGQSQQLPPLSQQQNQQLPLPSQLENIQSTQAHYQQNPGQIHHGQPDRSGHMPSQIQPENPTQRDFNVQTQGSHQMQTNSPHPIPSQHPQAYFIRPRQMPNEVTQLHNDIRGILEKKITVSLHNTIPGELTYGVNECVKLAAQDKFSHSIVCEIIIASLKENKLIKDVETGLNRLASFTLNILTDAVNFTGRVFEDGAGYFGNEVSSRLSQASSILPFLGYTYDSPNRSNVLSNERLGMPGTTETLIFIAADLLMAEQDLKTFHKIGPTQLIQFYELYPQQPEMLPSNKAPQTQSPQTSGNQAQYSSTHTPLQPHPGQQMQPHPGSSSDVPQQQGFRRTLEGQYNTGASVSQSTTHGHSSGMQPQRQNEPNPNNFNVAAHPSSTYNHPRTYPQDPHSNAPMMYLQTGRDVPSELPFQQMQNQPIGLNPPSGASGWACPHCTFVNSSRSRVCEACYKTPDSKVEQPAIQNMQSQTQQKICPRCNGMNRMQEAVCLNCNASFV